MEEEKTDRRAARRERKEATRRDRSKYKKTDRDKRERRMIEPSLETLKEETERKGRVISILPEGIQVASEEGLYVCSLRGSLKKEVSRLKNLIAVGDWVYFLEETRGQARGVILSVAERFSLLCREEHLHKRQQQILATNVDQVIVTVSLVEPPLKPALVDRYLIATYKGNMEPIIAINKVDLLEEEEQEMALFAQFLETYRALNIAVVALSVKTGEGMEALKQLMVGKLSVFSGQSGVGKSSLINSLTGLSRAIGPVVEKTRKGAHTTARAELIPLPFGGWCIDTPGIRSFGIWELTREDLMRYFPDVTEPARGCRYPNCSHSHEPGCALPDALTHGRLSQWRLDSYRKLLSEVKTNFSESR